MPFSVGSVSGLCGSVDFAPKARSENARTEIQDGRRPGRLAFHVRAFSRVGRDAANEVDGCRASVLSISSRLRVLRIFVVRSSACRRRKIYPTVTPRLSSLNVGAPAHFTTAEPWSSGIYKSPVVGRIPLSFVNLAGDGQADLTVHGGRDKAVCVYSMDHYPFWRRELGDRRVRSGVVRRKFLDRRTNRNAGRDRRHVCNRHSGRADLAAARAVLEARPPVESSRYAEARRAQRPHGLVSSRDRRPATSKAATC